MREATNTDPRTALLLETMVLTAWPGSAFLTATSGYPILVLGMAALILVSLALAVLAFTLLRRRHRARADGPPVYMTTTRWLRLLAIRGYLRSRGRRFARRRR